MARIHLKDCACWMCVPAGQGPRAVNVVAHRSDERDSVLRDPLFGSRAQYEDPPGTYRTYQAERLAAVMEAIDIRATADPLDLEAVHITRADLEAVLRRHFGQ